MKKILILFIGIVFYTIINAQPHISISGGLKLIDSKNSSTTLWYVDESPSRNNIFKDIGPIDKDHKNVLQK